MLVLQTYLRSIYTTQCSNNQASQYKATDKDTSIALSSIIPTALAREVENTKKLTQSQKVNRPVKTTSCFLYQDFRQTNDSNQTQTEDTIDNQNTKFNQKEMKREQEQLWVIFVVPHHFLCFYTKQSCIKKKIHQKVMTYSYLARTISGRLRDALALTE